MSLPLTSAPTQASQLVKIGVLAYREKGKTLKRWQPLAARLEQAIPNRHFDIDVFFHDDMETAISERRLDFILTNPGHYVLLSRLHGLSAPLATLIKDENGEHVSAFGGVIFTRTSETAINTLNDLKHKTVAAASRAALGAYQLQAYELLQAGIDTENDIDFLFTGLPHDQIVTAVLTGQAQAGFVRTGVLESLIRENRLDPQAIKVIKAQSVPEFPVLLSTRLCPEWVFAALPMTDPWLTKQVVSELFRLDTYPEVLNAMGIHGFDVPADYQIVTEILRRLKMPPFDEAPAFTLKDIWLRYHWPLLAASFGIGLIGLLALRLLLAKRELVSAYRHESYQRRQLQEKETRLRGIIETVPDCIKIVDRQGRLIELNAAGLALIEAESFTQVTGINILDLIVPQDREAFLNLHRKVLEGTPVQLEYEMIGLKGTRRKMQTRALPIVEQGQTAYLGISRDISREHRQRQLRDKLNYDFALLTEHAFFEAVCHHIAESLGLEYVLAGAVKTGADTVNVQGGWALGAPLPAFDYSLIGTPCEKVIGDKPCYYTGTVQDFFPDDHWLIENGIQSYFGVPLFNAQHGSLGILVGLATTVRNDADEVIELLELAAPRISGEIERERASAELTDSEQRFHQIALQSRTFVWQIDPEGLYTYVSPEVEVVLGFRPDELVNRRYFYELHPEQGREAFKHKALSLMQRRQSVSNFENPMITREGRVLWVQSTSFPVIDDQDCMLAYRGSDTDISARKQVDEKLQLAASVFNHAREGIMITGRDGTVIDVNEAFTEITGYDRQQVLGQNPRKFSSGHQDKAFYHRLYLELNRRGYWSGEIWNRHQSGELYALLATISVVEDDQGRPWRYVTLFFDITHIKEQQQLLEHMAHFDVLTGLPNRVSMARNLQEAMDYSRRHRRLMAVIFIDLDGFKAVNDCFGHDVGDELLKTIASTMQHIIRAGDTLARLGGDEFVAILSDLDNVDTCERALDRLLAVLKQPVTVAGTEHRISASIGVSFYPQDADIDADQLLRQADQAMYQAKLAGKDQYYFFDAGIEASQRRQHQQLRNIAEALTLRQFELFYQPKVNMRTGTLIGVEALIRWRHPEQGLLSPAAFLPAIASHTLDVQLGEWVLESALEQIGRWLAQGLAIPVSVNISPYHLQQPEFSNRLRIILQRHPEIDPTQLQLEILESSAFDNLIESLQILNECQEQGVRLALDDFGTGYSSLNYLKHLPVTDLKIDQSFVRDLLDDPDDLAILEGIIRLADVFQLKVIAEGVETVEHGKLLLMLGCQIAQGYGIAKPMPASALSTWVAAWQPEGAWQKARQLPPEHQPLVVAHVQLRSWITALDSVAAAAKFNPTTSLENWRLSIWLQKVKTQENKYDPNLIPAFTALHERVHRLFHQYAETVDQNNRKMTAATIAELRETSEQLIDLINDFSAQMDFNPL
ncbi:MAG: EAL domain-containing protein [Gammaproteobacteria bacterium]